MEKAKKRKVLLGVFIPLGIIAVFLTVFLSVIFQAATIRAGAGLTDGDRYTVLGDIEGIVEANPRIVDIAMIGAHGATSANVKAGAPINPHDKDGMLGKFDPLIKGFTYRFSRTEMTGVYELLRAGARYFQVKCCFYDGKWYGEHVYISLPLEVYIKDFIRFLGETKGEVVMPQLEPTYIGEYTLADLHEYIGTITYEGKTLYDYVYYGDVHEYGDLDDISDDMPGIDIGDLRYNDVTKNGTVSGVVLTEDRTVKGVPLVVGDIAPFRRFFDIDTQSYNVWHERFDSDLLLSEIEKSAEFLRGNAEYADKLRINQTQGSFNSNIADFGNMIGDWSLVDFANKHNPRVANHPHFEEWLEVMPVALFDYVTCVNGDFNNVVNNKIHAFNEKLVSSSLH